MFVMENIYTVEDYLNKKIHGSAKMTEAEKKIRLISVENATLMNEIWRNSIKVTVFFCPFVYANNQFYWWNSTASPPLSSIYNLSLT